MTGGPATKTPPAVQSYGTILNTSATPGCPLLRLHSHFITHPPSPPFPSLPTPHTSLTSRISSLATFIRCRFKTICLSPPLLSLSVSLARDSAGCRERKGRKSGANAKGAYCTGGITLHQPCPSPLSPCDAPAPAALIEPQIEMGVAYLEKGYGHQRDITHLIASLPCFIPDKSRATCKTSIVWLRPASVTGVGQLWGPRLEGRS